ncbi:carbohydrate ABC transporter permease [Peptoniphilus raoultii]|uniref:carbohydrate ABC transporter permease n=1 Tax=Peptoniphilus raoultii TaxID=1776387 RepID=UPI001FD72241|nr:hypothetical protein [Peptoniphilus raoultii]
MWTKGTGYTPPREDVAETENGLKSFLEKNEMMKPTVEQSKDVVSWASFSGNAALEAEQLDGAGNFRLFKDIALPASSVTGIYIFIMTIVQGLQFVFTPIKVVTQGGPSYASYNLIYHSYHEAFILYRTGFSSALFMITMLIFFVLLILEFKFVEERVYYEN